jgi:hypothetical protein
MRLSTKIRIRSSVVATFTGLAAASHGAVVSTDLAIIGYYMDGSASAVPPTGDAFSWVALNTINAGEVLYFSDSSYRSAGGGSFIPENLLRLTVPTTITAGAVSTVDAGNLPSGYVSLPNTAYSSGTTVSLTPSSAGDQLVIFQDPNPADVAGFLGLSAINASSTGWGSSSTSQTESDLYPSMTNGVNALAVGAGAGDSDEWDNVRYTGPTTGSPLSLWANIYDTANWEGTNDAQVDYVGWTNASGSPTFAIVPEPTSVSFVLLSGLWALGRRRKA